MNLFVVRFVFLFITCVPQEEGRMRSICRIATGIFLIISTSFLYSNPHFTIGSNPYYTIVGFPHDILRWPSKGFFIQYIPQTLPWHGNVTKIDERPNDTYISNYTNFEFPAPTNYTGNPNDVRSYLKVGSYVYNNRYSAGGIWNFYDYGKIYFEVGTNTLSMEQNVEGIVRNNETLERIPLSAFTKAHQSFYDAQLIYANTLFEIPIGAKVQYRSKTSEYPSSMIKFVRNNTEIVSNRLTWGWTTSPCAHIFRNYGEEFNQNFDAWFLNQFTVFHGYQLDLQLSGEYKNTKSGIRYRRIHEFGKEYTWQSSISPQEPFSNFLGSYSTDSRYEDESDIEFIRAYSKVRFWQLNNLDLGILFFLQYGKDYNNSISTNRSINSDPLSSDQIREFIVEVNPWLNYKLQNGYFDVGLLFEISYTSMRNIAPRWNSSLGVTEKEVIRNSSPYEYGFSPSWESFSQGRNVFFATGIEAASSINIIGRFSTLATLLILKKYSFITKEYGQSAIPSYGGNYNFQRSHQRDDFKNETWITGSIGFMHGYGPLQLLATMNFPLAYLLEKHTTLKRNIEKILSMEQHNVWAVQQPVSFRFMLIFGLEQ